MITKEAMKPLGLAMKDFYSGDLNAEVNMHRIDGVVSTMAISALFRGPVDFQVDKVLIDRCSGRILDVGAGAGIHSLFLQEKGFSVHALDVSPEICKVMQRRGVVNIICCNVSELDTDPFDTLLILGRSISMVETIAGLDDFLIDVRRLVKPGGQILLNSLDVSKTTDPRNLAYYEANRRAGRYPGEIRLYMEYKGTVGPQTGLLYVDPAALEAHAAKTGWSYELLVWEEDGNYSARLQKKNSS